MQKEVKQQIAVSVSLSLFLFLSLSLSLSPPLSFSLKINNFFKKPALWKNSLKMMKRQAAEMEEKYLQITYATKN